MKNCWKLKVRRSGCVKPIEIRLVGLIVQSPLRGVRVSRNFGSGTGQRDQADICMTCYTCMEWPPGGIYPSDVLSSLELCGVCSLVRAGKTLYWELCVAGMLAD